MVPLLPAHAIDVFGGNSDDAPAVCPLYTIVLGIVLGMHAVPA
jgi:hypothetical protein